MTLLDSRRLSTVDRHAARSSRSCSRWDPGSERPRGVASALLSFNEERWRRRGQSLGLRGKRALAHDRFRPSGRGVARDRFGDIAIVPIQPRVRRSALLDSPSCERPSPGFPLPAFDDHRASRNPVHSHPLRHREARIFDPDRSRHGWRYPATSRTPQGPRRPTLSASVLQVLQEIVPQLFPKTTLADSEASENRSAFAGDSFYRGDRI
jgi:hypothetical protein